MQYNCCSKNAATIITEKKLKTKRFPADDYRNQIAYSQTNESRGEMLFFLNFLNLFF